MFEVVFLGVGEAFDETHPNTSVLVRWRKEGSAVTLLLDCGFTAPPQVWREETDVNGLDGIWISHFHADHCFGLPALLVRFWEEGRSKELILLGQRGVEGFVRKCVDLAYPNFYERLAFPIRFRELEPGRREEIFGLGFQSAESAHSQRNLSLKIDSGGGGIYYSGDGRPTPAGTALAQGSQLLIHEAFRMETEIPGHGTVTGAIDMANRCHAPHLALVHVQREERRQLKLRMRRLRETWAPLNVFLPEPGDRMEVENR